MKVASVHVVGPVGLAFSSASTELIVGVWNGCFDGTFVETRAVGTEAWFGHEKNFTVVVVALIVGRGCNIHTSSETCLASLELSAHHLH